MAKCFTMDLSSARAAAVKRYFDKFRVLPPKNIMVSSTTNIVGHASFENLCKTILADNAKDFVLVVHGDPYGNGLLIPLADDKSNVRATGAKLKVLNDIAEKKKGVISRDDISKLSLNKAQIKRLLELRSRLHSKHIKVFEFRGCNLGRSNQSVREFKSFLGATTFGAPSLHSFFGVSPAKSGGSVMSSHTATHVGQTYTYTSNFGNKRCHCCIGVNLVTKKPVNGHIVADDAPTLDQWIQANLSASETKGKENNIPIHGLWLLPTHDNPDPFSQPRPIFPLAINGQGHNEYRLYTVYSTP